MASNDNYIPEDGGKSGDKVVIEPRFKDGLHNDQGGLLLNGNGKVISIGAAVKAFKPGDEVAFDPTAGQDVQLFGKVLKILKESEITLAEEKEL